MSVIKFAYFTLDLSLIKDAFYNWSKLFS